jgi:ribosomal protein S18 acetylase RimI-like enzyme
VILTEWRDLPAAAVLPLQESERRRWLSALGWDLSGPLEIIEDARRAGALPGYVAFDDDGAALGWTYFILHDGMLQIGGLSATRASVSRALLDAVLDSPEAALARRLSCFVYPGCNGVAGAFSRQRFAVHESYYLQRDLTGELQPALPADGCVRPWQENDLPGLVRLLETSYQGVPGAECFAPDGRRQQWMHYAAQLLRTPACGAFDPSLSVVVTGRGAEAHRLLGAVISTRLGAGTTHLAQVAVDPEIRGRGTAAGLVGHTLRLAAAAGFSRTTLMVDGRNQAARALYARLGFGGGERFLFGQRPARTRLAA